MQFEIGGFGGITNTIKINAKNGQIVLFGGKNGSGKTSIKEACAAILRMNKQPDGTPIKDCNDIVNDTKPVALARLSIGDSTRQLVWTGGDKPECVEENKQGLDYKSSLIAVQEIRFGSLSETDRSKELLKWTDAKLTKKDIFSYLEDAGVKLAEADLDELVDAVKVLGCESVSKTKNNEGKSLQQKFMDLTSTKWGSDKGSKWLPANLACPVDQIERLTVELIETQISKRQEELEDAIANEAILRFEGDRLIAVAKALPGIVQELTKLEEESKEIEKSVIARTDEVAKLKSVHSPEVLVAGCDHCHKENKYILLNGKLRPAGDAPKNKEDSMKRLIAAQSALENIRGEHGTIIGQVMAYKGKLAECEAAQKAIDAHEKVAAKAKKGAKPVEEARLSLDKAKLMLAQFVTITRARELDKEIKDNKVIQAMLAPDGLQQQKLGKALSKVNEKLKELCAIAKWPTVEIGAGMQLTFGGRSYKRISKGEKARCDLICQVLLAGLAGDKIVLIDNFEVIVGKDDRGSAVKLLHKTGTTALAFMAVGSTDSMPAIPEAVGQTFWVDGGQVKAMGEVYA